jgi:hypothetical protein
VRKIRIDRLSHQIRNDFESELGFCSSQLQKGGACSLVLITAGDKRETNDFVKVGLQQ